MLYSKAVGDSTRGVSGHIVPSASPLTLDRGAGEKFPGCDAASHPILSPSNGEREKSDTLWLVLVTDAHADATSREP